MQLLTAVHRGPPKAMFAPTFIQHRGTRILRIDYSDLSADQFFDAANKVHATIAAEPPHSVRVLSILYARLTHEAATALKRCALANAPYIRAGALVGTSFWRAVAAEVQARGREDLTAFDDEGSALDWLASR